MANQFNKCKCLKKFVILSLMATLVSPQLFFDAAQASSVPVAEATPNDADFLKLLDSLKNYNQTSDIALVSKIDSSFYYKDEKIDAELKNETDEALSVYLKKPDAAQSDSTKVLIKSLTEAYKSLKAKLDLQVAASKAFEAAAKEAEALAKKEQNQEEQCVNAIDDALEAGNAVNKQCNDLEEEEDKNNCSAELNSCAKKIAADQDLFVNSYLVKRSKSQPSKAGFAEVSASALEISEDIPASGKVCNNYSSSMAKIEFSGKCIEKTDNDRKNEAYQGAEVNTKAVGVNVSLDSNILTPKKRIDGWKLLKKLADDKITETKAAMGLIQVNVTKLGGTDLSGGVGGIELNDDQKVALLTNNGTTVPVSVIKSFFATNPSPEAILAEAAKLGLTKDQIAHAMNIGGYGGNKSSDLNNFAQTKAQEAKYSAMIDSFVASKGGNFNGYQGGIQVPGIAQVDATKNVMSNKGWITPEIVKSFFDTNPSDQDFFKKMMELGLRKSDIATILNGQGLLFKDGDPRQVLMNDSKFGSIYNRLDNELFQGTTGYGVINTYDPQSPITTGTGHISDEDNKSWIPFGFPSYSQQGVDTRNQAPVPKTFITGGQLGTGKGAVNAKKLKVIPANELKKLTSKK